MNDIFKAENLSMNYFGKPVLNGLNLTLQSGKVLGLLGPNGCGKTTLIKIAAGVLRQTSGGVTICGEKPGKKTKALVSYLPDIAFLPKHMSVKNIIGYYSDFYEDFDRNKAHALCQNVGINENDRIQQMSGGVAETLALVLTLSRNAKLYLLDEPFTGIDTAGRKKIMEMIIKTIGDQSSMIIATHLISETERLFDEVALLKEGRISYHGTAEELRASQIESVDGILRGVRE